MEVSFSFSLYLPAMEVDDCPFPCGLGFGNIMGGLDLVSVAMVEGIGLGGRTAVS